MTPLWILESRLGTRLANFLGAGKHPSPSESPIARGIQSPLASQHIFNCTLQLENLVIFNHKLSNLIWPQNALMFINTCIIWGPQEMAGTLKWR